MHTIIHILGRAQGKSRRVNAYRASLLCVRRPRPHTENGPRDTRETRWRAGRLDGRSRFVPSGRGRGRSVRSVPTSVPVSALPDSRPTPPRRTMS